MEAYRVPAGSLRSKDALILRVYAIVAVLVFSASGLVLWKAREVSYETRLVTAWVVGALVVVGVVGSFWLSTREGKRRSKLSTEYLLDEDSITLRRPGWPDITIPLSRITTVFEDSRFGLKVAGGQPPAWIGIPPEVSGFQQIRARLLRDLPPLPWERPPISPATIALNLAVLAACITILLSSDLRVVIPLGTLALLAVLNSVYWLWKRFERATASTRKKMGFIFLAYGALLAFGFVLIVRQKLLHH